MFNHALNNLDYIARLLKWLVSPGLEEIWKESLWPNSRPFPGSWDIRSSAQNFNAGAFRIRRRRRSVCISFHVNGPLFIVHRFMHAFMYVSAYLTSSLVCSLVNQYRQVPGRPWFGTLWVLTAVLMKLQVLWDMTQFVLVSSYWLSGGACCFRVRVQTVQDLDSKFLRNVDNYLPIGAASYARGLEPFTVVCFPPGPIILICCFFRIGVGVRGLHGPKVWNFARRCPTAKFTFRCVTHTGPKPYFFLFKPYWSPICKSALTVLSLACSSLNA